jgi:hypothetical protein
VRRSKMKNLKLNGLNPQVKQNHGPDGGGTEVL